MKKTCLQCGKEFSGRTDKIFCSLECKNFHHNSRRRQEYVYVVNAALQQNRLLLQKLLATSQSNKVVDRRMLEQLGFRFDLVTGYSRSLEGKIINKIYEFQWQEASKTKISIDPNLDAPVENQMNFDMSPSSSK